MTGIAAGGPTGESSGPAALFDPPFAVALPDRPVGGFVFDSPHSGAFYPQAFLEGGRLSAHTIRRSEDAFVDRLFAPMVVHGAPLIRALFPRAYLDLNREPYELDPRMFEGRLPAFANTRSIRVAGGLGTIPRIVADGHEIYAGRIPVHEGLARIETLYKPYHRALRRLITRTQNRFGYTCLIDCHSMPSTSLSAESLGQVDIVLGDRYGSSCSHVLTDLVEVALRARGFGVMRNKPYAGGFITEHYGEPSGHRHALQIEVNRALYMHEATLTPHAWFDEISRALCAALAEVLAAGEVFAARPFEPPAIAAE
ncbi:N-formylglutamate amidohydrolase [Saliniramus sp.]|uniref:N-formylglutamate amidohydrolase n=1 Tax=Saliniramus sp. TaxID=2986772 RepID=UPI002BCFB7B8|nr:N-formylglutamate amidohydrolase [Saliniramus sp.]HMB09162.1 N-formylglutamate amidohydrolase [Saliniramus sp.]